MAAEAGWIGTSSRNRMANQRRMGSDYNLSPQGDVPCRDHEPTVALTPRIVVALTPNRASLRLLAVAHTGITQRRRLELMQYSALRPAIGCAALAAQGDELALEHAQVV